MCHLTAVRQGATVPSRRSSNNYMRRIHWPIAFERFNFETIHDRPRLVFGVWCLVFRRSWSPLRRVVESSLLPSSSSHSSRVVARPASGQEVLDISWVGSGQNIFKLSRVGFGRIGSGRPYSTRPDPTRPASFVARPVNGPGLVPYS